MTRQLLYLCEHGVGFGAVTVAAAGFGKSKHSLAIQYERRCIRRFARNVPTQVVESVEKVQGEKWESFRERHGDSGRDLAVTIRRYARRLGGNTAKRRRLAEVAEMLGARS